MIYIKDRLTERHTDSQEAKIGRDGHLKHVTVAEHGHGGDDDLPAAEVDAVGADEKAELACMLRLPQVTRFNENRKPNPYETRRNRPFANRPNKSIQPHPLRDPTQSIPHPAISEPHSSATTITRRRGRQMPFVKDAHIRPEIDDHIVFCAGALHVRVNELCALPLLEIVGEHTQPCKIQTAFRELRLGLIVVGVYRCAHREIGFSRQVVWIRGYE